jgi:glycosyltransferase involved in cell wall biosynthesis
VLCDTAVDVPEGVRVHEFGASTKAQRGAKFVSALMREKPAPFLAHMVPVFAVLAAPIVRTRRMPLGLWYTHWKAHSVVRMAEKAATHVLSVDKRSFPVKSKKVKGIGHGIDVSQFSCSDEPDGPLRALVLGRYSPSKGLETILAGANMAGVRLELYGSDQTNENYTHHLEEQFPEAEFRGAVPRSEVPKLFSRAHVLINNMRPGAPDKVVYEAAASCLPVLASNPVFDDLLPAELRFPRNDPRALAARLRTLDRRRRPELRELVTRNHSVEHWADAVVATLEAG